MTRRIAVDEEGNTLDENAPWMAAARMHDAQARGPEREEVHQDGEDQDEAAARVITVTSRGERRRSPRGATP